MILVKLIFYLFYIFYRNIFREKVVPHYFAAIFTAIILASIYSNIVTLLFLYYREDLLYDLRSISKYVSLGLAIIGIFYVHNDKRWKGVLKSVESISMKRRIILLIVSGLFSFLSMVLVFYLSEFVREINLGK